MNLSKNLYLTKATRKYISIPYLANISNEIEPDFKQHR